MASIDGQISIPLPESCPNVLLTEDSKLLLCTEIILKNLKIFINTGSGFQLHQTIPLSQTPYDMKTNKYDSRIYLSDVSGLVIFQRNSDNTFSSYSSLPLLSTYNIALSEDETMLVVGFLSGKY